MEEICVILGLLIQPEGMGGVTKLFSDNLGATVNLFFPVFSSSFYKDYSLLGLVSCINDCEN